MLTFALALLFVPLADQGIKFALRRQLAGGSLSLGPLGIVQIVQSRIWLVRPMADSGARALWLIWATCAIAVVAMNFWTPLSGTFAGLLLGGSLSHLVEMSREGCVSDYVRLRFWPAFNLADVVITVGAFGLATMLLREVPR